MSIIHAQSAVTASPDSAGAGLPVVSISNRTLQDNDVNGSPWTFSCQVDFVNNGTHDYYRGIGSDGSYGDWISPAGTTEAALFEIRATQTGANGTATRTGTLNTWQALSTTRSWSISSTTSADKDWIMTIEIRDAATSTVQDTATYTLKLFDAFS